MLEKTVKQAVKKRLKAIGAYQFWAVPMGLGETTLDCLGCYQGRFFSIETKAPGKLPTLRQKIVIEKMRASGGLVFIVDNVETARSLFDGTDFSQ